MSRNSAVPANSRFRRIAGRVQSSLGTAIFLGAVLTLLIPLALYRVIEARRARQVGRVALYGGVLALQLVVLVLTQSRGPVLGLFIGLLFGGLLLPDRRNPAEELGERRREYTTAMIVEPLSPLVGRNVEEAGLRHLPGLFLVETDAENALVQVWVVTAAWIAVRGGLGLLRVWPGIGRAPLSGAVELPRRPARS